MHLLNAAGQFQTWADMELTIQAFVGMTDSMTFGQLGGLLAGGGIRTVADVSSLDTLKKLQADIVAGELGVQNIRSDWFQQPISGPERYALPQTFTFFGQKFVPDSWVFSQTVFNSILWVDESGATNPVFRRVPGALDAAFAVLHNDQVVPELVGRMKGTFADGDRPHATKFRDGLPYQHNLAAVRTVMDQQRSEAWESNIYMNWLSCLRELSPPTTDPKYPEAMRTRAWAMKTLNTELASWTQLRHDTILYAKQSYTGFGACSYPSGFVEPRVEFWVRLRQMATRAADLIAALKYDGTYTFVTSVPDVFDPETGETLLTTNQIALTAVQSRQLAHLRAFASTVARLEDLARKEVTRECFTPEEERFIDTLMEDKPPSLGSGGPYAFTGWYPNLFYRTVYWTDDREFHGIYGSDGKDLLVADVHTDVPNLAPPDPGSVLHQGVGYVNLLMMAVESGVDRFVCAGPVFSHYEFEVTGDPRRINDQEWQEMLSGPLPEDVPRSRVEGLKPPAWTQTYLVPFEP